MWFWALHGLMKQVDHQRLHAGDIGSYSVQGDHWPAKRVLLRVMLQRRSLQQLGSSPSSAQLSAGAPEPRSHTSTTSTAEMLHILRGCTSMALLRR